MCLLSCVYSQCVLSCVCSEMCALARVFFHVFAHISFVWCALICLLSCVWYQKCALTSSMPSHVCSPFLSFYVCSHMFALMCLLSYACSVYALICAPSRVCSYSCALRWTGVCSHTCGLMCVPSYVSSHVLAHICTFMYVCVF